MGRLVSGSLILATLFMLVPSGRKAWAAGGEDFPFRCITSAEQGIRSFVIKPDSRSCSAFTLTYRSKLGWRGTMSVNMAETEDGKHYLVIGTEHGRAFDRHIFAKMAKVEGESSYVSYQVTLRGVPPREAAMKPAHCVVPIE